MRKNTLFASKENMRKREFQDMMVLSRKLFRNELGGMVTERSLHKKAVYNLLARMDLIAGMCAYGVPLRKWRDTAGTFSELSEDIERAENDAEVCDILDCLIESFTVTANYACPSFAK